MADNSSTSSSKFFIQLGIIILMVAAGDYGLGKWLEHIFLQQEIGEDAKVIHSVIHTEDEIIVFGASYGNSQYDSKIFEDRLGKSCYNAGIPGQSLLYHTAVQECILTRYEPEMFIVDINPGDIVEGREDYERLSILLPYVKKYPVMRDIVFTRSKFERYKMISQTYPYNSTFLTSIFNRGKKDPFYKGYQPFDTKLTQERFDDVMKTTFVQEVQEELPVDPYKLEVLHRFLKNAGEKNIPCVFVISPKLFEYTKSPMFAEIQSIIESYDMTYIDWKFDPEFQDVSDYRDIHHLNRDGASKFSNRLANKILKEGILR